MSSWCVTGEESRMKVNFKMRCWIDDRQQGNSQTSARHIKDLNYSSTEPKSLLNSAKRKSNYIGDLHCRRTGTREIYRVSRRKYRWNSFWTSERESITRAARVQTYFDNTKKTIHEQKRNGLRTFHSLRRCHVCRWRRLWLRSGPSGWYSRATRETRFVSCASIHDVEVSTRAGNVTSLIARDVRNISLILVVRRRIVNTGLPASWGFKSPLAVISWESSEVSTRAFLWISTRVPPDRKNMLDRVQRQQGKSLIKTTRLKGYHVFGDVNRSLSLPMDVSAC